MMLNFASGANRGEVVWSYVYWESMQVSEFQRQSCINFGNDLGKTDLGQLQIIIYQSKGGDHFSWSEHNKEAALVIKADGVVENSVNRGCNQEQSSI